MPQSVILIHTLPDARSHFDWLIDQPEISDEHRLLSFRCNHRPDRLIPLQQPIEHLPNHRSAYLTYEGPVSKNRGSVRRLAVGLVLEFTQSAHSISLLIQWEAELLRYKLDKSDENSSRWQLQISTPNSPLDA